jgi:lactosylceramide 4-alpha-galactosyltransferase
VNLSDHFPSFLSLVLARANPTLNIYIVFISLHRKLTIEMSKPLNALLTYSNVHIVLLKFSQFAKETPAETFIANGGLKESHFPVEHTSDVFRLQLLWKYGGTYLDSDMIVRKSLAQLGTNFACTDGEQGIVSNAFLNFDRNKGRHMVETFITDQLENFNETAWGFNGPQSFSKVATKICKGLDTNKLKKMKTCDGFHIHPRHYCFPILPTHYKKIFKTNFTKILTKKSKHAVTVHLWNKLTKNITTSKNEKNFFTTLARSFCPKVFKAVDSEF